MSHAHRLLGTLTALTLSLSLASCDTLPPPDGVDEPGAVSSRPVLSEAQVAQRFFQAYKSHNRAAAAKVASSTALDKLSWDASAGSASNLRLEQTDDGYAIAYDGGAILLTILSDGHVGANVADVEMIAD
ncbi:hypothetical protein [Prosthecobacter sp.]|uniref:hypothetical protein n=1 Tax=Prosthecobacter sp. TaxID=1965333 RepID=UPI003783CF08